MSNSRDISIPPMLWPPPQEEKPPSPYDADVEAAHPPNAPRASQESTQSGTSQQSRPPTRRRRSRAGTIWGNYPAVVDNPHRLAWEPGQEPGLDPSQPNGGRDQRPDLHTECDITVVDFSEDDMVMRHLTNESLPLWLEKTESLERLMGEEQWVKCRWINVNGLSWDVIQALGKYKKLHRLAIEDMLNTKNRTKADWYSDHTYIVMTLQKLVKVPEDSDSDSETEDATKNPIRRASQASVAAEKDWFRKLRDVILGVDNPHRRRKSIVDDLAASKEPDPIERKSTPPQPRTLQRYNGGPNVERMTFMEQHSAMARKNLAVCAEQVSIFLLASNTVISFFESSAEDIESPILKRLATPETILRRSCDASMLTQAIIDAIIDLAMPIATTYSEIIQELELDVLTAPSIRHTRDLYILTSETNTMRNFISPIATLVRAIRDHKSEPRGAGAGPGIRGVAAAPTTLNNNDGSLRHLSRHESAFASSATSLSSGIEISGTAYTYLGDVEDHCISIVSDLDQIAASAANMISLIFQTVSAYQNESMRQLTTVTIIFLPLTFITGYFGMNLDHFPSLNNGEPFFWSIAAPVAIGTGLLLMRQVIGRWVWKWVRKWGRRRRRLGREKRAREKKTRKEA